MTFTRKATDASLGTRIDEILKAFSALRRRSFWKDRVKGGLFVVETTRGRNDTHWHVHLHCLVEGDYVHQGALRAEWLAVTGDSSIVDVRAVHNREKALNYVCKYISKGSDIAKWDDETICEFAQGVHRRRLFGTFGKWHKVDVSEDRDTDEPDCLPRHGTTWAKLNAAMESGSLPRAETAALLWHLGYLWRLLLAEDLDDPPAVTLAPGALSYDPLTRVLLDVEGVPEREQGPPPLIRVAPDDTQGRLFSQGPKL